MTERLRVSAKQISMFGARVLKAGRLGGCPRSYAAYYNDHIRPEEMDQAFVDGIKAHAVAASLVKHGKMPAPAQLQPQVELTAEDVAPESKYGIWARKGLVYLPESFIQPGHGAPKITREDWQVEQQWLFPWTTSKGVECDIDLRPDVCAWTERSAIELVDFKFISDKRYALDTLVNDPQANLYAYGLPLIAQRVVQVDASWIYTIKKAPHASWKLGSVFKVGQAEEWIHANLDATIELISVVRENKLTALDLPGDDSACQGRGFRCDAVDVCFDLWGPREPRLISLEDVLRYKNGV